jgi:hypothetical protein
LRDQLEGPNAATGYNVLRDGLSFTVLKPDLVYSNDGHSFHSEVDFSRELPEIPANAELGLSEYHPRFRVKAGEFGYELAFKTAKSVKAALNEHGDEPGLILVATVPYHEFSLYQGAERTVKWERTRKKLLNQYGWKPESKDDITWWPEVLEHKYFTVYYKSI